MASRQNLTQTFGFANTFKIARTMQSVILFQKLTLG